ncbi:MAG: ATP-binding cassette domain-containing protein [Ignavibacteriales bacterium]|jgi:phospholipid/cholesterol/gamma-HCH transport system ATP-binding protein|nr:ATP-binding cassette domain-containing protein [Ignavibacteriaceae bacterium]NLH61301.1 ATP-binding cassette domain-containing protein [Ignavibacteriales bacterium]HOJ18997.1 ATP-binding cassette domain-containing protein [Ignavibacteriaceae bacterium]HPO54612.1 ATP-binding cassette domain-containing protein [Ignavibacteriaceae bacterium]
MADVKVVEVINLSKSFGDFTVLDNISLTVMKGENLVIFGRSGTGKSVLLKCMVGLLIPDNGDIFILGEEVRKLKIKGLNELRKNIGFLFQSAALYDSMSVRENLAFPLIRNFKFSKEEVEEKVVRALENVTLLDSIDKMPSELSGGMRKRIGLARSIITEPALMLYDEPTTGLDPITTKEISYLIRDLQEKLDMTSMVVTHDLLCAQIISDKAIVLKDGGLKYKGKLDELTKSSDPFLKDFFSFEKNEETPGV